MAKTDGAAEPKVASPERVAAFRTGISAESRAAAFLMAKGYRILAKRYRTPHGEIDIVARRRNLIAFVEVKARRGDRFGQPVEAVNWRKQKELAKSAQVWIDRHGRPEESYRFDVVGVLMQGDRVRIRHVEDAFKVARSG